MVKLTQQQKDQLRRDKASMSIVQLTEKYGVSKATVHRVLADGGGKVQFEDRTEHVEIPMVRAEQEQVNPAFVEFADVLAGREPNAEVKVEEKKLDPVREKALESLAESMFQGGEDIATMPKVRVEDPIERTAVLQRIMLNLDNFAPLFSFIHNRQEFVASLHRKSVEELKGILTTMEQTRTTLNLANQIKNTFLMVGKATEVLAPKFLGLKTDGFVSNLMAQKQELDMIFRELAIDYAPKFTFQTRPEIRLAMLYGMTLLQVDNTNRIKDYVEQKAEAEVPKETQEAFADL
jgi:hypothetical protein